MQRSRWCGTPAPREDKDHDHDQAVARLLVRDVRAAPSTDMIVIYALAAFGALSAVSVAAGLRILKRYEPGEPFRVSRVMVGLVERMHRVSLGIVTMPMLAQAATRDDVCVDVRAVLCFRRVDASVANVNAAMNSIAQRATRAVVGRRTLAATLSEPDSVVRSIREIVDHEAQTRGVTVTAFRFESVQLPGGTGRDMASRAGAEHEQRPTAYRRRRCGRGRHRGAQGVAATHAQTRGSRAREPGDGGCGVRHAARHGRPVARPDCPT